MAVSKAEPGISARVVAIGDSTVGKNEHFESTCITYVQPARVPDCGIQFPRLRRRHRWHRR
jgi:hypothetical protein